VCRPFPPLVSRHGVPPATRARVPTAPRPRRHLPNRGPTTARRTSTAGVTRARSAAAGAARRAVLCATALGAEQAPLRGRPTPDGREGREGRQQTVRRCRSRSALEVGAHGDAARDARWRPRAHGAAAPHARARNAPRQQVEVVGRQVVGPARRACGEPVFRAHRPEERLRNPHALGEVGAPPHGARDPRRLGHVDRGRRRDDQHEVSQVGVYWDDPDVITRSAASAIPTAAAGRSPGSSRAKTARARCAVSAAAGATGPTATAVR